MKAGRSACTQAAFSIITVICFNLRSNILEDANSMERLRK